MEEDFLEAFLAGKEMDVINQQDIDTAKVISEIRQSFAVQSVDVKVAEFLAEQVFDLGTFFILTDSLCDCLQQMRFTHPVGL